MTVSEKSYSSNSAPDLSYIVARTSPPCYNQRAVPACTSTRWIIQDGEKLVLVMLLMQPNDEDTRRPQPVCFAYLGLLGLN